MSFNLLSKHTNWFVPILIFVAIYCQPLPARAQTNNSAVLNHLIYQSRSTQTVLQRAENLLKQKDFVNALDLMQRLVDGSSDSFFWTGPEKSILNSVRHAVRALFENLPADGLRIYEETRGTQAQQLLKKAIANHDRPLMDEVARRFFATQAGFVALDRKATRALDQGDVRLANTIWSGLLSSRIHGTRCGQSIVSKAMATAKMLGDDDQAKRLMEVLRTRLRLPAQDMAAINSTFQHLGDERSFNATADWTMPLGNASHTASLKGSAPCMNPIWRVSLDGNLPFAPIVEWEAKVGAQDAESTAISYLPLVVNGQVIFRDFNGISGCDADTGRLLWRYSSTLSLPALWEGLQSVLGVQGSDSLVKIAYAGNSLLGMISSDGDQVFAIEFTEIQKEPANEKPANRFQSKEQIQIKNRLIAFKIPPKNRLPNPIQTRRQWVAGRATGTYETAVAVANPLDGHLFLGAPLPVDGSLFVITESDRVLNLVKINAQTGEVVWMQRIGLVEQPFYSSSEHRRQVGCYLPTHANGLVICPTQSGMLTAVDVLSGATRWVYYYGEAQIYRGGFSTHSLHDSKTNPGFADPPHVIGGRVYYLPRLSSRVHCIDLASGKPLWTQPQKDSLYIAAVDEQNILLVGAENVRNLNATTGESNWIKRITTPAGRGVSLGNEYIVPLTSGTVANINMTQGTVRTTVFVPALLKQQFEEAQQIERQLQGQRLTDLARYGLQETRIPSNLRLGNLVAHGDNVYSMGPRFLTAYPQQDSLARRPQATPGRDINTTARTLVAKIINQTPATQLNEDVKTFLNHGTPEEQTLARWLLRQLLEARLSQRDAGLSQQQQRDMIRTIGLLAHTEKHRSQVALEEARWELDFGSQMAALNQLLSASDVPMNVFLNAPKGYQGVIAADTWRRQVLANIDQKAATNVKDRVHKKILADLQAATREDSLAALRHFVSMYRDFAAAGRVRNRLADRLIAQGLDQEAELLLLENRTHPNLDIQAVSELLMISLLDRLDLHGECGLHLHNFANRYTTASLAAVIVDNYQSVALRLVGQGLAADQQQKQPSEFRGSDFLNRFDHSQASWTIHEELKPLAWDVDHVNIVKQGVAQANPNLADSWSDGRDMTSDIESQFAVIRRGPFSECQWDIVDRFRGTKRGSIGMPGRYSLAASPAFRQVGHFIPAGTMAGMSAISLLETQHHRPLWSYAFPPAEGMKRPMVEPGPAFPSICIFQTRKHLMGIHPASGKLLWRRTDFEPTNGLYVDKEAGLFGDEKILIMFHDDYRSYDILDTQTGATLRQGKLDLEFNYLRRLFGRKLMHVTRMKSGTQQRLRIWDPLTNKFELDQAFVGRFYVDATSNNEVVIIDSSGHLQVIEMPSVKKIVDIQLGKEFMSSVVSLRVFSDADQFYVNTQKTTAGAKKKYYFPATNSAIPFELVQQGNLMAIDRNNGEVRWSQPTRQTVVLALDRVSLPFLVTLSRVRPRNSSRTQTLEMEIIDRATGTVLGAHQTLFPDRIVHYRSDRKHGRLTLNGLQSRIDLDFSPRVQELWKQ